jgi:tetratricopeptide (TPR) repeat protein
MIRRVTIRCLLAVVLAALAAPAARAGVPELLQAARSAPSLAEAEKSIQEAERQAETLREPERSFARAEVMRTRGQVNVAVWRGDPAGAASATPHLQGQRQLLAARDSYTALVDQLEKVVAALEDKANGADISARPEYREAQGNVSRATYMLAWTNYDLTTSYPSGDAAQAPFLQAAVRGFETFTGDGYKNHPIVTECFLGQAQCLLEQKKPADAIKLLEPATTANTPADTYRRIVYCRVKAFMDQSQPAQADAAASKYLGASLSGAPLDPVQLSMALEWAKALKTLSDATTNPSGYRAAQTQLASVKACLYAHGRPWSTEAAKLLGEPPPAEAGKDLKEAADLFNAKRYKEALAKVEATIAADPKTDRPGAADLRYVRLASLWNLGQWRDAHLAAYEFLRLYPRDARAPDVFHRALQAGMTALDGKPPLAPAQFDQFMVFAQAAFPADPELQRVPWTKAARLLSAKQYREAEAACRAIPPASPYYRQALYGAAFSAYKQAEELRASGKADSKTLLGHLGRTVADITKYIASLGASVSPDDKPMAETMVRLAASSAQMLLDLPDPGPKTATDLVIAVRHSSVLAPLLGDRLRVFDLAMTLRAGKLDDVLQQVDATLSKSGPGDVAAAQALVSCADPLESQSAAMRKAGDLPTAKRIDDRLLKVYEFLVTAMRQARDAAFRDQEPSVHKRLGDLLVRQNRPADAIDHYERVLEKVPKEKAGDTVRGLALCYEGTHHLEKALELWRFLAAGFPAESDDWYEAKLHLVTCYWESGQTEQARKLLDYFRLQHPKGVVARWKAPYDALYEKMNPVTLKVSPAAP